MAPATALAIDFCLKREKRNPARARPGARRAVIVTRGGQAVNRPTIAPIGSSVDFVRACGAAALFAAALLPTGCDVLSGLPVGPVSWIDPADVSAASRASGPFGVAIRLPIEPRVQNIVTGAVAGPDEVVTYEIGAVAPGDTILAEVISQDRGFDPAVAVFDADLDVINLNDDRNYYLRATDPVVQFTVRNASDECYIVVAPSIRSDSTGAYQLRITLTPEGDAAPEPAPQIIYLDFDGASSVVVGGRAPVEVPPFTGSMIDEAFANDTVDLRDLTIARVRSDYAPYDVVIVTSVDGPPPAEPHSTVYFGSYNPTLLGLADSVDTFNYQQVQRAVVFVDTFSVFMSQNPTVEEMGDALGNVASHEIGHLLGLHHTKDAQGIMDTSATLRQMLRRQSFRRSPINGDTFAVGFQDAPRTLLANVGGDADAAYSAEATLLQAKVIDPWYEAGPQFPVRQTMQFGSGCTGH